MFRIIIALLQISLITGNSFAAPEPSPSAAPDGSDWKAVCNIVDNKTDMTTALKTFVSPNCQNNPKCIEEAKGIVSDNFGQIAPQCHAAELAGKGKAMEITSVTVYAAAAATCAISCATQWFGGASKSACTGAGVAATVLDLGMTTGLTIQKMQFHDWYQTKDGKSYSALEWGGTAAGAVGAATSTFVNTKDIAIPLINKTITGTAGKTVENAGSDAAKEAAKKSGGKAGSCFAAALLAGTAALKYMAIPKSKKVGDSAAQAIGSLTGTFNTSLNALDAKYPPPTPGQGYMGIEGATQATQTAPPPTNSPGAGMDNSLLENGSPHVAAATSGSMGDFLKNLGPPGSTSAALNSVGFDPQKFASSLNSGMSPGAAMAASAPGMPASALQAMQEMDELAKSGQIAMNDMPSTAFASAGHAAAPAAEAPKTDGDNMFMPVEPAAANGSQMDFDRTPASGEDSHDIWHRNFQGTIFDIISKRIAIAKPQ